MVIFFPLELLPCFQDGLVCGLDLTMFIDSMQWDRHYSQSTVGEMFCCSVHVDRLEKKEKSEVDGWLKD